MQATAKASVISLMEEHLSGVIRDALSVQRHAKRGRLHLTADSDRPTLRRRIHAADVNLALQLRGCERLYATHVVAPEREDAYRKIDLATYLRQEATMEPPTEVAVHRHWLAVDGEQPEIPENPDPLPTSGSAASMMLTEAPVSGDKSGLEVHQLQSAVLSEELQLYFTRVTVALERGKATAETAEQHEIVLQSLGRDTGLQELVPFMVRYIQQELYRQISNVEHCRTLVRAATALLRNSHLHLELQIHELLPALMTCVVAKRLSEGDHWALRREAAMALLTTCQVFGNDYVMLQARILRALCDAIGPEKGLPSRYGGFVAITLFGPTAIDAFLLPSILDCWEDWERVISSSDLKSETDFLAVRMCQQVSLTAVHVFLDRVDPEEQADRVDWDDLADPFGDRLVAIQGSQTEYAMCFV